MGDLRRKWVEEYQVWLRKEERESEYVRTCVYMRVCKRESWSEYVACVCVGGGGGGEGVVELEVE